MDTRREGFDGARRGIDRAATMTLQHKLRALDKYRWRCILAGATATTNRLFEMDRVDSPMCPACGSEEETCAHIFVRCPQYNDIRFREIAPRAWELMPDCLRIRGLMPCGVAMSSEEMVLPSEATDRAAFVSTVQYTLLDILTARQQFLPDDLAPQPRWQRNVRPRLAPLQPVLHQPILQPQALPAVQGFVPGGELRTANGEHLQ